MTTLRWLAVTCLLVCAGPAAARPYTVEDLLRLEDIGPGVVDPTGRWLLQEFQPRYDRAPRFDNDVYFRPMLAKLMIVDLRRPGPARPAFAQDPHGGYVAGPFSPDGKSVVIYRDLQRRWEAGILTLATAKVRWLGFGIDFADRGETVAWRSTTRLVALRLAKGDTWWKAPLWEAAMQRLPQLWKAAASGKAASGISTGSGRYRDVHVTAPPREVVEVDVTSGRVKTFARGLYTRLALSPSGRMLALIESSERAPLSGDTLISPASQLRRAKLQLLDLDRGGVSSPCTGEPLVGSLRWSPVADTLLAFVRPRGAAWAKGGFVEAARTGACAPLQTGALTAEVTLGTDGATATAHGEWLGAAPIVRAHGSGATRSDWYAFGDWGARKLTASLADPPNDPVLIDGERAVFLDRQIPWAVALDAEAVALSAQKIARILPPRRANNSTAAPDDHALRGPALFATSTSGDRTTLLRLSTTQAREICRVPAQDQTYVVGSDAGLVTDTRDAHGVRRLELTPPEGPARLLLEANTALAAVDFATPREIDHLGPGGEPLKSWLYLPPGAAGGKPPLLVIAYPGAAFSKPSLFGVPGIFLTVSDNVQLAVGHGYAVLVPSLPKPSDQVDPGKGWAKQIFEIVERVKQTGWVDTDRTGYWGHSFGGYAGLMMATETDRFRAIVAASPVSDLISFRGEGGPAAWLTAYEDTTVQLWAGWTELGSQGHLLGTPWTERERYIANSPVFFADRIRTPILLVQGDQDLAGIGQSREMFSDLYRLGKDALFLTFYGEGHSIVSPQNVRKLDHDGYAFLDAWLKSPAILPNGAPNPPPPQP